MKVNDYVTRNSHQNDVLFRIVEIKGQFAILLGVEIRLLADAQIEDLRLEEGKEERTQEVKVPRQVMSIPYLKGKILHIDGDEYYLKKAMEHYRQYGLTAAGYYVPENEMPNAVEKLLERHHPDILVLTGHDALQGKDDDWKKMENYRNSLYFVKAVESARNYDHSRDTLVIIAGACQSNYEALIFAGANFASSPKRENIHLLDPVILAGSIASTSCKEYVDAKRALSSTISHHMGGVETRGQARSIY